MMARWPGRDEWAPVFVARTMEAAAAMMRERFAGTVAERRVQPARLYR